MYNQRSHLNPGTSLFFLFFFDVNCECQLRFWGDNPSSIPWSAVVCRRVCQKADGFTSGIMTPVALTKAHIYPQIMKYITSTCYLHAYKSMKYFKSSFPIKIPECIWNIKKRVSLCCRAPSACSENTIMCHVSKIYSNQPKPFTWVSPRVTHYVFAMANATDVLNKVQWTSIWVDLSIWVLRSFTGVLLGKQFRSGPGCKGSLIWVYTVCR